ncbi:MAG: DUF6273 domain-containing protein [Lachnospiraceae bacterium]|nr:DUF6273 domain-containing protein [Lachnospiraceae bacterium]
MRFAKKTLYMLLAMFMVAGLFGSIQAGAKEITLPVPTIKVKSVGKGTGFKVTISKTKEAEGFEVFVYGSGIAYGEYKYVSDDYQKIAEVKKNGNAKRTVTIKSLPAGSYKIKVRSYNSKKFGTMTYSEFSKEKSVKIKEAANGYKASYDFSKVKKGDTIKFGSYEQDNNFSNGQEPIEWIVLEKTKKDIFVVSKYALDSLPYNKEYTKVTWEDCTLRKWLNDKFYTNAFNKTEIAMIKTTTVENFDNAISGTSGGNDTKDKVFLLSQLEMINSDYGFDESYDAQDLSRRCAPTAYGKAQEISDSKYAQTSDGEDACSWWLRSSSGNGYRACFVGPNGRVNSAGNFVEGARSSFDTHSYIDGYTHYGIRPAMRISLKS